MISCGGNPRERNSSTFTKIYRMNGKLVRALFLLPLFSAGRSHAQSPALPASRPSAPPPELHSEANWKQVCSAVTSQPFVAPAFDHPEAEVHLKGCDETALYYGFDHPPDPQGALQCGYYQRAHPKPSYGDPFYGPGVLTMLYANGLGVDRNYDLAIRFACENSWAADAEMEYRIGHLEHLRDEHNTTAKVDLCDDGTSGLMMGACADVQEQFSDVHRALVLKTQSQRWAPQVREAFNLLQAAEKAYEDARTGKEVDRSGTGRAAFMLYEQGKLRDQFLINLHRFGEGTIPHATREQTEASDAKLNDVYHQLQDSYGKWESQPQESWRAGTIRWEGISDTEDSWLKLRDAWIDFSRVAYPNLKADWVKSQLTHLRIHQLQSLLPK
ncbi:MAG TPA: DUF1311 domain-containing protein [Acidisarcina sp.]